MVCPSKAKARGLHPRTGGLNMVYLYLTKIVNKHHMACAFFHADHVSIYIENEGHGPEK